MANWLAFRHRTRRQFIIISIRLTCQSGWWRCSTLKGIANPAKLNVCPAWVGFSWLQLAWLVCPNNSQLISRQAWRNEAQSRPTGCATLGPFRRFYLVRKHLRTNFWALTGPPPTAPPFPLALPLKTSCMPIGLQFAALSRGAGSGRWVVAGVVGLGLGGWL